MRQHIKKTRMKSICGTCWLRCRTAVAKNSLASGVLPCCAWADAVLAGLVVEVGLVTERSRVWRLPGPYNSTSLSHTTQPHNPQFTGAGLFVAAPLQTAQLVMPRPPRAEVLSDDARMTSVYLSVWRLSAAYVGPKSRTERPRKTKVGTEVAHVTHDSDTTFKVILQGREHIVAASRTVCYEYATTVMNMQRATVDDDGGRDVVRGVLGGWLSVRDSWRLLVGQHSWRGRPTAAWSDALSSRNETSRRLRTYVI